MEREVTDKVKGNTKKATTNHKTGHKTGHAVATVIAGWILTGVCCGIVCGGACVFFSWLTMGCDEVFHDHDRLLFALPLAGILVVLLYDEYRKGDDLCLDALFRHMRGERKLSYWIAPLIAVSTCLAYLTGGSVGRVGSALQIGGGLAVIIGEKFAPLRRLMPPAELLLACGIAAGFTGILNTPLAGAVFGVEVLVLQYRKWVYVIPTLMTAFITWGIARAADVSYIDFHGHFTGGETEAGSQSAAEAAQHLATTGITTGVLLKVVAIAFAAMLIGRLYCFVRKITTKGFEAVGNKYLRVITGTILVIALTQILGHTNCNGIGFSYVEETLDGHSAMLAFLWKLMLTAFTLGCGIRGGEIAPTIFIGATGCFSAGCLIGLDPSLAAAVGIVGALASVTNCPIAVFIYGLEAICLSGEMALYFAAAACMAHFLSGSGGLYGEQHAERQFLKPALKFLP